MGELYRRLKAYSETDEYPYHMPGHKRQVCGELPQEIMNIDITEIDGFDNLHAPEEILLRLQEEAARLYGAEESFYLVNGSTCGVLAAISAAVPKGGRLLMTRGGHKSAYHAAYLRNLTISYLYPEMMQEYDIYDAITPEQIAEALAKEPVPDAVFLVSPTYEGRIADIEKIAQIVHSKGIPLIVDEAHGAHLGLAEGLAKNSCQCGADLVIHSVHKTLPALTQSALLHVNGNRIDRDRLRRFLHIYQSSSPSYVLMAGIDNALQVVEEQGDYLFTKFQINYLRMLTELSECDVYHRRWGRSVSENDRCAACNRPRYHCGKMAEQTEAGRQRRGGNLSLSAASRSADAPCPGLGCRKRRNSVVTGSGKNRRRFRESVSTRDSCAGTGRTD